MGRYLTQPPLKRLVKKQQVFTVSGTFTPSQALLDAGGAVEVRCIGGGGGGGDYYAYGGGSSGMDITRIVTVTGPVTVTIGAGGYGNQNGQGGKTQFGTLLTALGGNPPGYVLGGRSSGEGSQAGENVFMDGTSKHPGRGGGSGGGGGGGISSSQYNGLPNTGGGGCARQNSAGGQGGSGLCIVTWEE